uniref:Calcineurin-like phosphoesterase domain-containing protein 1 n=2 Tax=Schizaphis graminum TaxID=13262 RepID=A0A2S2P0S5_SCHGA
MCTVYTPTVQPSTASTIPFCHRIHSVNDAFGRVLLFCTNNNSFSDEFQETCSIHRAKMTESIEQTVKWRRHEVEEKIGLDQFKNNQLWTENFYFVIVSDVQFGYIKPPSERDSKDWKIEMDKAIFAIDKINNLSPRPQFLVVCGDLVNEMPCNEAGLNELQINDFKKVFSNLHPSIPLICVCGNHDIGDIPDENSINKYRDHFGQDYFSFWCGGVLFLVLNSQYYKNSRNVEKFAAEQDQWLTEILSKHEGQRIIVFQHIPWFLSKTEEEIKKKSIEKNISHKMLEKLCKAGVSHVFSGHHHINSTGFYKNLEIVVTCALGAPMGEDPSGLRIVKMYENNVIHTYYPLEQIPSSIKN